MKKQYTIKITNILKGIAILIVMLGHYFRYAYTDSVFSGVGYSIGYFGAALFAFLSGFGIYLSYEKKGFGQYWLINKFIKIYVPFLIVNMFSMTIYWNSHYPIWKRIFWITDDEVLWYIPFILVFYILFYFVFSFLAKSKKIGIVLLIGIGVLQILLGNRMKIGSNWYTATASLLCGILVATILPKILESSERKLIIYVIVSCTIMFVGAYMSKKICGNSMVKDMFTSFLGVGFCMTFFILTVLWYKILEYPIFEGLAYMGSMSLELYLIHMKVMEFCYDNPRFMLILYFVITILLARLLKQAVGCLPQKKKERS